MGDDNCVRKLVEVVSAYKTEEKPLEDLTHSLTSEFIENFRNVMFTKELAALWRWGSTFKTQQYKMISSPEMYLRHVIYACRLDARLNPNTFEGFLNVFGILLHLSSVTLGAPTVNFSELIPEIFMEFYDSELKKPFLKSGGFQRLVAYVNNPKYLAAKVIRNFNSPVKTQKDFDEQLELIEREQYLPKGIRFEYAEIDEPSVALAQKVIWRANIKQLSVSRDGNTNAESGRDLQSMEHSTEKRLMEATCTALEVHSFSNFETNDAVGEQYSSIIQAVIRCNRLKVLDHSKLSPLQKEVFVILERLKDNIKSFIKFLDDYDHE